MYSDEYINARIMLARMRFIRAVIVYGFVLVVLFVVNLGSEDTISWWIWIAIAYTFALAMHGYYALVALPARMRSLRAPDPAPVAAAYVPPTGGVGYVQPQYYVGQGQAQPQYMQPGVAVSAPYAAPYPPTGAVYASAPANKQGYAPV
eukprot:CAMPEP_0196774302 /NCGR_PEP_ID=MMETSP1104-20130614/3310_1 /TAXON_ID=33652 /ORGANISM="Cafeteria sp., Strain Caron Lab Isolate" /LENGTH=147 /DNA_ID=CAMNT_0042144457 /DNA_START=49 /DNA_END=492 /DNA_ORIENTATION=-